MESGGYISFTYHQSGHLPVPPWWHDDPPSG